MPVECADVFSHAGKPKTCDLRGVVEHQHIRRPHIAMDDAVCVECFDSLADISNEGYEVPDTMRRYVVTDLAPFLESVAKRMRGEWHQNISEPVRG
jgi:hypothetical protein